MKIWIDCSTAPDPLFFGPIVRRLEQRGHTTWITVRRYGETVAIAQRSGLPGLPVGRHGGRTVPGKAAAIAVRAWDLARLARRAKPDIAVSYNSYAQALAAWLAGIPLATIMDYEYQPANHLAFRLARRVIVPRGFDRQMLRRQGATRAKVVFHEGLKEHVTLVDFQPDPEFPVVLAGLGIMREDVLVTMRPPATRSTYHRFENPFFDDVVRFVAGQPRAKLLMLPRYEAQAAHFRDMGLANLVIPGRVLDGLNLVFWSDVVAGAGGSMNREAVVLGTPAYTLFRGTMAGVDRHLIARGLLEQIASVADLPRLVVAKKPAGRCQAVSTTALEQVLGGIMAAA